LPFPRIESPRAKKNLTFFKIKIISCTKIKINDHCGKCTFLNINAQLLTDFAIAITKILLAAFMCHLV
jgi:hypothetical protein